jgi:hypothetical protein
MLTMSVVFWASRIAYSTIVWSARLIYGEKAFPVESLRAGVGGVNAPHSGRERMSRLAD